jgi:hypothetical protein
MGDSHKDPCDLMYEHLKLIQGNIDKYDNMEGTIRNWTITLWSGTLIAGLIQNTRGKNLWILIGISIAIPIIMGIYDQIFKTYREHYKRIRNELIDKIQKESYDMKYIMLPKQKKGQDLICYAAKSFIDINKIHVNLVYYFLIFVSILITAANILIKYRAGHTQ